jgi:uncharacterized protein YggE
MKTGLWLIGIIVLAIATVGLAGCGTTNGATSPVSVNVNNQQGVWVSGEGKVTVTPDIATLNLGISVQAARVADAQPQAAEAMSKVIAALTSSGVAQKDISTRYFTIAPVNKYDNNTQQSSVTGYEVSNIVNVTIRSIAKVGTIIDAATAAGGDATRINSISFSVEKPEQYYSQARKSAMDNAKANAQELASLAGVNLGKPFYINENTTAPPIPYDVSVRSAGAASSSIPINPGQTDVILNIQVAYNIQ